MDLTTATQVAKSIKLGVMYKVNYITYGKVEGYSKETTTTIRFVEYAHLQGVEIKGKPNKNENYIVDNILLYNSNTNNYYFRFETIETPYKAKVKYYYNGIEITKEEYEKVNPPRKSNTPLKTFIKKIQDIKSIG